MRTCWFIWVTSLLLFASVASAQDSAKNRWNPVSLRLVGPLDSVTIDCGRAGATHIEIPLLSGEKRNIQVPLPIHASFVDRETDVTWQGTGAVLWPQDPGFETPSPGKASSLPLPLVPNDVPVLPMASALALVALALLLYFLRGKTNLLIPVGLLGSALLLAQVGTVHPDDSGLVRIIEINGTATWRVLDSARDSMLHEPGQSVRMHVRPAGKGLHWWVTEEAGNLRIRARSKGSLLRKDFDTQPGMRRLSEDLNALGNLDQVWVREDSGQWTARGAWLLGTALPEPVLDREGPPSWLVSALPQGPTIWVARLAEGVQPIGKGERATQTWLRVQLDS
ncbi:MAG: hypothetical protein ACI87O_003258 [Planctomycetota bacterium]|jgi:hypothetical protein